MLKEQKELLAKVRAAEQDALRIYNAGVKLGNVVENLRDAAEELEERIRYIEKNTKAEKKPAAPPPPKKSAIENPKS